MTRRRAYPVLWLALVWVLLWGSFSLGNLVNGLLVALLVTTLLPLPEVPSTGRLDVVGVGQFAARFAGDLLRSSLQVAWLALRPGPPPVSSVVAVPLRTRSELVMTLTTEALSLVPGSIVVELDTRSRVLYAHVLDAGDADAVEAFRVSVLELEARARRALGDHDDQGDPARAPA